MHYEQDGQEFTFLQFLLNKAVGNKDMKYLKERRTFLEKFLNVLGKNEYFVNSDEFKMFSRQTGDIEKTIRMLPTPPGYDLFEKFQSSLGINTIPDQSQLK
jgi:hypothetical protein